MVQKATLRIPTKETYAYIEVEIEAVSVDAESAAREIVQDYLTITRIYKELAKKEEENVPPFVGDEFSKGKLK